MKTKKIIALLLVLILGLALMAGCAQPAEEPAPVEDPAEKETLVIGAAMPIFDDKWLSYLYDAIKAYDEEHDDVEVIMVDAKNDSSVQLSQIETFITQGVDAIVSIPVDVAAFGAAADIAKEAGIPLIAVNRTPLPADMEKIVSYVGSDSIDAGTMQAEKVAELIGGKGNVVIMNGELGHEAATMRTQGNKDVLAKFPDIKIIKEDTGRWQRSEGMTLMENWIQAGQPIAAVLANNDEMAIGAIMALEAEGKLAETIVAGVDATPDALEYIKAGKLSVSVFQDAVGQGRGGIETAVKAARGEAVEKFVWIPFQLVTKENYEQFIPK
ncbi:MAG: sugar ABC transporter substrate-binding protein [Alkaliphilus sp.]|nr:sugar ABC transporter substrate-binding protein [Alkaliphilus sp.]